MVNTIPTDLQQYVLVAAPHTSNWDFVYAVGCFHKLGIPIRFTIKDSWLRWPFKGIMTRLGAIGIDRSPRADGNRPSMTEAMVELFGKHRELIVLVTPEGTRSARSKWKTGFYHVAHQAGVPIALGYLDYSNKECGVTGLFETTGSMENDMARIMAFYNNIRPRFPEKYSPDARFNPEAEGQ